MTYPIFSDKGAPIKDLEKRLPGPQENKLDEPEDYHCSPELEAAVNVSLIMNQPLLVTGEPGSGKTQLSYKVAHQLNLDILKFETKSTSMAQDLFYTYNTIRRFHSANKKESIDEHDFITYRALGEAILQANPHSKYEKFFSKNFIHKGPKRSVVLIDEIDKAPLDFPNDILNEIERMYFKIPQLDTNEEIKAENYRPIVIMTSNSEKQLPDAFLRRCVFHHIEFPDSNQMTSIVTRRLRRIGEYSTDFIKAAIELFYELRDKTPLYKKPATGELLVWINVMRRMAPDEDNPMQNRVIILRTLGTLIKNVNDIEKANTKVAEWMDRQQIKA